MKNLLYCLMLIVLFAFATVSQAADQADQDEASDTATEEKTPEEQAGELQELFLRQAANPDLMSPEARAMYDKFMGADERGADSGAAEKEGGIDLSGLTLEGQQKMACEALLCLSSGQNPAECMPSLEVYFGIFYPKDPVKTVKERQNFLDMCPKDKS